MENSMKLYNGATKVLSVFVKALFRVKVIGAENEHSVELKNTVVCANHMSNWDPVILACVTKNPVSFMGKAELFKIPVLGFLLKALGAFPINRGVGDIAAIKLTIGTLKDGNNICLFPQGTRCIGKKPSETEVKSGVGMIVSRSMSDVLPVGIYTKNYKIKLFRRVYVVIGKPIAYDNLGFSENTKEEYQAASDKVFAEICALAEKAEKGEYDNK